MKTRFLLFTASCLFLVCSVFGQNPVIRNLFSTNTPVVANIAALTNYAGANNIVFVSDTNRGGLFTYTANAITHDDGICFTAVGIGSGTWVRNDGQGTRVINACWYGATGDDTTDDSAAIQAAVDRALYNSGLIGRSAVYIPSGRYRVDTTITITPNGGTASQSGITIYGDGAEQTWLETTKTDGTVILHNDGTDFVHVRDLGFKGPSTQPGIYANAGLYNDNGARFDFRNLMFHSLGKGLVNETYTSGWGNALNCTFNWCDVGYQQYFGSGMELGLRAELCKNAFVIHGGSSLVVKGDQQTCTTGLTLFGTSNSKFQPMYCEGSYQDLSVGELPVYTAADFAAWDVTGSPHTNVTMTFANTVIPRLSFENADTITIAGSTDASWNGTFPILSGRSTSTNYTFDLAIATVNDAPQGPYTVTPSVSSVRCNNIDLGPTIPNSYTNVIDYCFDSRMNLRMRRPITITTNAINTVLTGETPSMMHSLVDTYWTTSTNFTQTNYVLPLNLWPTPGGLTNGAQWFTHSFTSQDLQATNENTITLSGGATKISMTNTASANPKSYFRLPPYLQSALLNQDVVLSMWVYIPNEAPWTNAAAYPTINLSNGSQIKLIATPASITGWKFGAWNHIAGMCRIIATHTSLSLYVQFAGASVPTGSYIIIDKVYLGLLQGSTLERLRSGQWVNRYDKLDIYRCWTNSLNTFVAATIRVTNNASATASKLLDFEVNGSSVASVNPAGLIDLTGNRFALATAPTVSTDQSGVYAADSDAGNGYTTIMFKDEQNTVNELRMTRGIVSLTDATATKVVYIPVANDTCVGGVINYTIFGTTATTNQVASGVLTYSATALGTTEVSALNDVKGTVASQPADSVLTWTWTGDFTTNNVLDLKLNADTDLATPDAFKVLYTIIDNSSYKVNKP